MLQGKSKEEISSMLMSQGWQNSDIEEGLNQTGGSNLTPGNTLQSPLPLQGDNLLLPLIAMILGLVTTFIWLFSFYFPPLKMAGLVTGLLGFALGIYGALKTKHIKISITAITLSLLGFVLTLLVVIASMYSGSTTSYTNYNSSPDNKITTGSDDYIEPTVFVSQGESQNDPIEQEKIDLPSLLGKSVKELQEYFGEEGTLGSNDSYVSFNLGDYTINSFYDLDDPSKYRYTAVYVGQSLGSIKSKEEIFKTLNIAENSSDYILKVSYKDGDQSQFIIQVDIYPKDSTDYSL